MIGMRSWTMRKQTHGPRYYVHPRLLALFVHSADLGDVSQTIMVLTRHKLVDSPHLDFDCPKVRAEHCAGLLIYGK